MKKRIKTSLPRRRDVPASVGLVSEVRDELIARIDEVREDLSGQVQQVLVAVHQTQANVHQTQADVHQLQAAVDQMQAAVHRTQAIVEEQRSENRIVLEGLHNMIERQNRLESEWRERP